MECTRGAGISICQNQLGLLMKFFPSVEVVVNSHIKLILDLFNDRSFIFGLRYELVRQLQDLLGYVGPLRIYPRRIYQWSGESNPLEWALVANLQLSLCWTTRERSLSKDWALAHLTVEEYVAQWLKRLGVVHDFRVESLGRGQAAL